MLHGLDASLLEPVSCNISYSLTGASARRTPRHHGVVPCSRPAQGGVLSHSPRQGACNSSSGIGSPAGSSRGKGSSIGTGLVPAQQ